MSVPAIPDYVEPRIGWRAWLLERGDAYDAPGVALLRSVTRRDLWLPREPMRAVCLRKTKLEAPVAERPRDLRTPRGERARPDLMAALAEALAPAGEHAGANHDEAPAPGCRCGIYSMKTLEDLLTRGGLGLGGDRAVVGRVAIWGRVVEGTQGWRSEFAYPIGLCAPRADRYLEESLARTYGCVIER